MAFAPINSLVSSNINVAYAEKAAKENEDKELSPEEVIKKANDFLESDAFKALSEDDKKSYKELIKDLNTENVEDRKDDILDSIKNIELSYINIKNQYEDLKEEVLNLKADSLSDDLKKELKAYTYKDSYETYEDYETQIKNLKTTKEKIENYNKELEESKSKLKDKKAVLDDEKSNLDDIKYEINSVNEKEKEYKRKVDLETLEQIIAQEGETKKATFYKKASQSLKDKFNQSLESIKLAYNKLNNKEEVNNVEVLVNAYDSAYNNLDGIKNEKEFNDKYEELKQYFEKNKDKLSGEDQERFAKLINELPDKEDSNLESIEKLKAEIDKAIEENQNTGKLKKVSRQVAVKKQPAIKKSRSFVRTGVKSVWIFLAILIIALVSYFFISKKDKK